VVTQVAGWGERSGRASGLLAAPGPAGRSGPYPPPTHDMSLIFG
jgi:hypothetical protein